ncbi:hypothetical protein [Mucilaginibacter sp. PPCGB 2223]|uniref:DUF6712 family protein n=1 Tax=Mucilaginibacter sp. PPCGB 2223 TaxID=1886027 RepID=UPI0011118EEF|nr:hypothetical protein [Mucilaginibacter sp. PPCGB 2223]
MEPLLITKSDFIPYRNLTVNMDDSKRLEPFILEAQRIDLSNLLGKRLYFDMMANIASYNAGVAAADAASTTYTPTTDEQWFQKLLTGCGYTYTWPDRSTTTKIYAGLKPVLVYLSYARFVRSDNVRSTQSGFVKKTVDFATQVSDKEIQAVASRAEADANAFFTGTEDFMADNAGYFGKYITGEYQGRPGDAFKRDGKRTGTRLSAIKGNTYLHDQKKYLIR